MLHSNGFLKIIRFVHTICKRDESDEEDQDKDEDEYPVCYVRGNHRVGVSSSDFRRVEISEETIMDWMDKDTLQLLEAIMHYGDDWRKVAQHVGGRSEKDCITHFIKLRYSSP
ncbi:hypothetical protein Dsin_014299 [Dipteronia sinensis]|uniref:Uncharacterized protein n=1 Tax=Dipteronia sinensis TaxID=43782 RepID=A0AAE0E9X0_9ROSI|nr:hypothetical protein Dsin_014299 [Dipteronia sinensis]